MTQIYRIFFIITNETSIIMRNVEREDCTSGRHTGKNIIFNQIRIYTPNDDSHAY